jgi:hypothetical protein
MPKKWIPSLALGVVLAAAPAGKAAAQNSNNELFLQSFLSSSSVSILTSIFASNVSFSAGSAIDIRQFNGTTLGPSLFYQTMVSAFSGALTLTPNIQLAANTIYAVVIETTTMPGGSTDNAYSGGSIYVRNNATSPWVNANVDVAGFKATMVPVTATPEPATMALMASGLAGLGGFQLRRRKQS